VLEILTVLIAIASLFVSIRGCVISKNAEKNAEEANALSKQQFFQTNRPHVLLSPALIDDNMYWRFSEEANGLKVYIRYKLHNVGNVAATDISLPKELMLGPNMSNQQVTLKTPDGNISLGPSAKMLINSELTIKDTPGEKANVIVNRLRSEESKGLTLQIAVEYKSEVDKSQRFRTVMMNRIHNERAEILKSEMYQEFDEKELNK
jgi:hypothetical protein